MICVARRLSRADLTTERLSDNPPKNEANMIPKMATATIVSAIVNAEAARYLFELFRSIFISRLVSQILNQAEMASFQANRIPIPSDDATAIRVKFLRRLVFPTFAREYYASLKPFATV